MPLFELARELADRGGLYLALLATNVTAATGDVGCGTNKASAWTEGQADVLRVVPAIGAFMSLIGCSFIIFTYFYFEKMSRNKAYQLILYMSCADLAVSFAYLLGIASNPGSEVDCTPSALCYVQASMSQYFETASFFWVFCIAANIYTILVAVPETKMIARSQSARLRQYHMLSWGVPAVLLIITWLAGSLGDAGAWCWIKQEAQGARIMCYYLWLILIMCVNVWIIEKVRFTLRADSGSGDGVDSRKDAVMLRLRLYVILFVGMHLPSVINRVQNLFAPDSPVYLLYLLQAIFEPLNGFANAVVYGMNRMVFKEYQTHFNICRSKESDLELMHQAQPTVGQGGEEVASAVPQP